MICPSWFACETPGWKRITFSLAYKLVWSSITFGLGLGYDWANLERE